MRQVAWVWSLILAAVLASAASGEERAVAEFLSEHDGNAIWLATSGILLRQDSVA